MSFKKFVFNLLEYQNMVTYFFSCFQTQVVHCPTWKMMATNVINWSTSAVVELNAITKIHKFKGLHEGHHFIQMDMEVHGTPKHDMHYFTRECVRFFHDRRLGDHLSLSICTQFFKHCVSIAFQRWRDMLILDLLLLLDPTICMHVTLERWDNFLPQEGLALSLLWLLQVVCLLAFLWPSLLSSMWWFLPSVFY